MVPHGAGDERERCKSGSDHGLGPELERERSSPANVHLQRAVLFFS